MILFVERFISFPVYNVHASGIAFARSHLLPLNFEPGFSNAVFQFCLFCFVYSLFFVVVVSVSLQNFCTFFFFGVDVVAAVVAVVEKSKSLF